MIDTGWARAYRCYSDRYVEQENQARAAQRGIWREECLAPSDRRRERRE